DVVMKIQTGLVKAPSHVERGVPPAFDEIVLRALEHKPAKRFATARAMARAIEEASPLASPATVGDWVEQRAARRLGERASSIAVLERGGASDEAPTSGDRRRVLAAIGASGEATL